MTPRGRPQRAAMRISRALRMLSRTQIRIRRMHVTLIFTGAEPGVHERSCRHGRSPRDRSARLHEVLFIVPAPGENLTIRRMTSALPRPRYPSHVD